MPRLRTLAQNKLTKYNIRRVGEVIGTGFRIVSLFSGSSGNATLVASGRTGVLVDAGVTASRIAASLDALGVEIGRLRGALISH